MLDTRLAVGVADRADVEPAGPAGQPPAVASSTTIATGEWSLGWRRKMQ